MRHDTRSGLLAGCALGVVLALSPVASAQSFNGTPTPMAGFPSISTDPGGSGNLPSTSINLGDAQTVINWTTVDATGSGNVEFQPANTTALFFGGDMADFTVLNRIIPVDSSGALTSSTVSLNGNVIGLVGPPGDPIAIGGQVWFYSPTGIVVGSTAQFAVGSLLLTTHDIDFEPNSQLGIGYIHSGDGVLSFNPLQDPESFVQIQSGAQITASGNAQSGDPGYVALVSTRIAQSGNVSANGGISYLAAEQVDMTINAGLVDFTLTVGTTDANGIVHDGTTTGPASTSTADRQVIAMVALPKNDALTMLLSGSIGYEPAASVALEGSTIILSSGFESEIPTVLPDNRLGNISIAGSTFSNDVTAWATNGIGISPGGDAASFAGNATFNAAQSIDISAEAGETISVAGNLNLYTGDGSSGGVIDVTASTAGTLPGGLIDVDGTLSASATSVGILPSPVPNLDSQGGTVSFLADGGTIDAGFIYASADGYGASGTLAGGNGAGGAISASVQGGGIISAETLGLVANGYGGDSEMDAGDAFGGTVTLSELGGQFDLGTIYLEARAFGGAAYSGVAGDATGGIAGVRITGQSQAWDNLSIESGGYAGFGYDPFSDSLSGSVLDGGESTLSISGPATLELGADLYILSDVYSAIDGVPGFLGQAGDVTIAVSNGGNLEIAGALVTSATAYLNSDLPSLAPDRSPTQTGGTVEISAIDGSISATNLSAHADAHGLFGQSAAGAVTGGTVIVSSLAGGSIDIDDGTGGSAAQISASAFGSPGSIASALTGGTAQLIVEDGAFGVNGAIEILADGRIDDFFDLLSTDSGFNATGGNASIQLLAGSTGTANLTAGAVTISAVGDSRILAGGTGLPGGEPVQGNGGDGTGGVASLIQSAGILDIGTLDLDSQGFGGASAATVEDTAFQSGNGTGGTSRFSALGGTSDVTGVNLLAGGFGGGGAPAAGDGELAALAGNGTGGTAEFVLTNGIAQPGAIQFDATGYGADGMAHLGTGIGSDGGLGTGGNALFTTNSGTGTISLSSLSLVAQGIGGAGGDSATGAAGNGGQGSGGVARASLADGAFALGPVNALADGVGGNGGAGATGGLGGSGVGGSAQFVLADVLGAAGARTIGDLNLFASGVAGSGSGTVPATVAGSTTLSLDALSAFIVNGNLTAYSRGTTAPAGAGFTATVSGAPLNIAGDATIETTRGAVITANEPLNVTGSFLLNSRSLTETGLLAAASVSITSPQFIQTDRITSGGTALLLAANGPIAVNDLNSMGLVTALAQSVDIGSTGALSFDDLEALSGPLSVETAGNLQVDGATGAGAVTLRSTGGSFSAGGAINSTGTLTLAGQNGLTAGLVESGGPTSLESANGAIGITALTSAGAVTASGQSISLASSGALTIASANATAGPLSVQAVGDLAVANATSTGLATLLSTGGSVMSAGTITAGGGATVEGLLGVTLGLLNSGGPSQLASGAGDVTALNLTSSGNVSATGINVDIASPGSLQFEYIYADGGNATIGTAGDLGVESAYAGENLTLDSGGTFSLSLGAIARDIHITSSDIVIDGGGGFIGQNGITGTISLINGDPSGVTYIGGPARTGGYSLDADEAGRLSASERIVLGVAPSTLPADQGLVEIGSLALSFEPEGNIGSGGTIEISTPAQITVNGAIDITTVAAEDTFLIDPTFIAIDTSTGSISLTNAGGAPLGTLSLVGDTVAVATTDVLAQLRTPSSADTITALLDQPGGIAEPLTAGTISVSVSDGFYVQNTGASTAYGDRRGFNAGSLFIQTARPDTQIAVNGQIVTPNGVVTGLDTTALVTINGVPAAAGGQFDPRSTINGCIIGSDCSFVPEPQRPPAPPTNNDLIPVDPGDPGAGSDIAPLIELVDNEPLITPPLVDEPITGVGNDDLWESPCTAENGEGVCQGGNEQQ